MSKFGKANWKITNLECVCDNYYLLSTKEFKNRILNVDFNARGNRDFLFIGDAI